MGQQRMPIVTNEGMEPKVLYQVAEVSRPPIAVSATCDRGNVVVYGSSGGFIHNLSTGARTHFGRERWIYELDLWVKTDDFNGGGGRQFPAFCPAGTVSGGPPERELAPEVRPQGNSG